MLGSAEIESWIFHTCILTSPLALLVYRYLFCMVILYVCISYYTFNNPLKQYKTLCVIYIIICNI